MLDAYFSLEKPNESPRSGVVDILLSDRTAILDGGAPAERVARELGDGLICVG